MKIIIYPYNMYSESAAALKEEFIKRKISCKRVYPDRGYIPKKNDLIINWGNSSWPNWINPNGAKSIGQEWSAGNINIINMPHKVADACNKLKFFTILKDSKLTPEYVTTKEDVKRFYNSAWVARQKLEGSGGEGIVLIKPKATEIPEAPLYVSYIKKKYEFRVHVFNGKVIDVQQKRKKSGSEEVDYQVRNHDNGWVFARENLSNQGDPRLEEIALKATKLLMLDFGAVDIVYNEYYDRYYVLEINTAPGLEGATITHYANAITNYIHS